MSNLYDIIDADLFAMDSIQAIPTLSYTGGPRSTVCVWFYGSPEPREFETIPEWRENRLMLAMAGANS